MKIKGHKVVRVRWNDASSMSGWRDIQRTEPSADIIESIGILIKKNKHGVVLSTSISEWGNSVDPITIPKHAIQKLKYL